MERFARVVLMGSLALLLGCSADPSGDASRTPRGPTLMMPASPQTPVPMAGSGSGFGNPTQMAAQAGSGGAPQPMPTQRTNCKGGLYLGTYTCEVDFGGITSPLEGDASFTLAIDETSVPGECDAEFCPDLVIAEGSGTLFGLAGFTGFEAKLEGGLDCQTGEFRASAPKGVYGLGGPSDPNDPNSLWTVLDPPYGEFMGTLTGMHGDGPPERIEGDWDLAESMSGTSCIGPFMVELQP